MIIGERSYSLNGEVTSDNNIQIGAEKIIGELCYKKDEIDLCERVSYYNSKYLTRKLSFFSSLNLFFNNNSNALLVRIHL